jgi:recombination associated protein RdgC
VAVTVAGTSFPDNFCRQDALRGQGFSMFKNLQLFRLPQPWDITIEQLNDGLSTRLFNRPGNQDSESRGWVSPQKDGPLVHAVGGQWLVSLCIEKKLLPSSVVKQVAAERVSDIEEQENRRVGRKELREIKERVTDELLPRAFTTRRHINAWIDPSNGWLVVDAASASKAEEVIELLGKSLESFPLSMLHTELSPTSAMTEWLLSGEAPAGFSIDRDCEMKSPIDEKPSVRYARHTLDGEEIKQHIAAGKLPTRLAMTWQDRMSFVLTEKGEIKSISFLDVVTDEIGQEADTAEEIFDTNFALMTGEVSRFLPDIVGALGGEAEKKGA